MAGIGSKKVWPITSKRFTRMRWMPIRRSRLTDEDARALEAREQQSIKKSASDTVPVSQARPTGTVTTTDLPEEQPNPDANDERGRNKRKG